MGNNMSSLSHLVRLLSLAMLIFLLSASAPASAQAPSPPSPDHNNTTASADITGEGEPVVDNPSEMKDLRNQYGGGLRYLSDGPVGSRIEYGKPLDRSLDDSSGQWEFTMGSMF